MFLPFPVQTVNTRLPASVAEDFFKLKLANNLRHVKALKRNFFCYYCHVLNSDLHVIKISLNVVKQLWH